MIRIVIGLFVFAVALCAYIISTQHGGILPKTPVATAQEPVEDAPIALPTQATDDTTAQILESIVTRDLGYATMAAPVGDVVANTLAELGLSVPAAGASAPDQRFAQIVGRALKSGTSDTDIIAIVDAAARSNQLTVPQGLVQADRVIDTATFLKAVVTTAVIVTENTTPVAPDLSNDPTAIIAVDGYHYVVTPTDSLASIAVKFYGDVSQTTRIAQANPVALGRPDQIAAGTTILIPTF